MSTKAWIIFVAICVVAFGGLVIWSQKDAIDVSKVDENSILAVSKASGSIADHVDGNKNAKVVLIEYGDFQCPGCGAVHPRVKSLMEKYGKDVAFVFRNFPLTTIHPNARSASAAAEAAGLSGKYWEMHNIIYESQDEWSNASAKDRSALFEQYAVGVGLDKAAFTKSLNKDSADINKKISFDQALGRKIDVSGTPTFYLNGTKLAEDATSSDEVFEKTIQAELKKQGVNV